MRFIKRLILIIFILAGLIILLRAWLYGRLVTYKSVGQQINYPAINKNLLNYIEANSTFEHAPDIKTIIKRGLILTSRQLNFTAEKNNNDPNKLINSNTAHCVGYASFFATTCNYLLKKYELADTWVAKTQVGQLYFVGSNVHTYFTTSFFKDHDFVTIENKITGEIFAVDTTVSDYLYIDYVTIYK